MRVVNPIMRRLVARGVARDQLMVLHYTGRRSGNRYDTPAGYQLIDDTPTVFTNSGWRHNFAGGRAIEVTYRGRRQPARAVLVDDPDEVAAVFLRRIQELGLPAARRRLGIRINVGRLPTAQEVREVMETSGLSMIRLNGLAS